MPSYYLLPSLVKFVNQDRVASDAKPKRRIAVSSQHKSVYLYPQRPALYANYKVKEALGITPREQDGKPGNYHRYDCSDGKEHKNYIVWDS